MSAVFEMPEALDADGLEHPTILSFAQPGVSNGEAEQPASDQPAEVKIASRQFATFAEARHAYEEWAGFHAEEAESVSFRKFLFLSEREYHKIESIVQWSFQTDPRWMKDAKGEFVERPQDQLPAETTLTTEIVQPAEATTSTDSISEIDHDEKFWKEIELMSKLRAAELERQEAQTQYDADKEALKEQKEFVKGCTIKVARIAAEIAKLSTLPDVAADTADQPSASTQQATVIPPGVSVSPAAAEAFDESEDDESWRYVPTLEIAAGIAGVGKKKLEDLVDFAPTLGDLVDKQAEAGLKHMTFKEILPKGWGSAASDALEEKIGDVFIDRRRKRVAEVQQSAGDAEPAESTELVEQLEQQPEVTAELPELADL
mgnify:CR=1 FL=1